MASSEILLKPERVHQISYRRVANLMHLFFDPPSKTEAQPEETGRANELLIAAAAIYLAGNVPEIC